MTIREPARDLPVAAEVDLCVVGGSCTGVFAAVRAARLGARVALIEKQNCFGGMATAGAVCIWHSLHDTTGARPIIAGLTLEVIERLRRRQAVTVHPGSASRAYVLNTEELKIELDELIVEHRIEPFLHTLFVAPLAAGDELEAVVIEGKDGRQAIRAKQFIDATGDGDLALALGLGSHGSPQPQPPTTCAKIQGLGRLTGFDWQAAVRQHGPEFGLAPDWGWGTAIPGLQDVQMRADTHVFGADTGDGRQLARAEIEGRRQVRAIMDVIRRYGPAQAPIALVDLAATLGIREHRRLVAQYRLAGDDVLLGRRFDDAIANGSYRVDVHHADGPGITFRYLDGTEEVIPERGLPARRGRWRPALAADPTFYQIPYRCLLPGPRLRNLLLAGRLLDADPVAFSAVRVMVTMNQTGEAAGVAAALALTAGTTPAEIGAARLRQSLRDGGSLVL